LDSTCQVSYSATMTNPDWFLEFDFKVPKSYQHWFILRMGLNAYTMQVKGKRAYYYETILEPVLHPEQVMEWVQDCVDEVRMDVNG